MIIKRDFIYSPKGTSRPLHIYLPEHYFDSDKRYPVTYFFDGHNLFFDSDATYGKCWGLKEFLDGWWKKVIVVGIECAQDARRLSEYCPYDVQLSFSGDAVEGLGDVTFKWLIQSLKKHIDKTYRTYPLRECTAIAGSSMGGLMAMYGVLHYNEYFSKAAVVSPAISDVYEQLLDEFNNHEIIPDTRVFFSWGMLSKSTSPSGLMMESTMETLKTLPPLAMAAT